MKQLRSANLLAGQASFKVPSGQYLGFLLRANGTNAGGATTTLANLGLITGTWRGVAWLSVSFANMNVLGNHMGGVAETASAIGAAMTHSCFILASYGQDGNIFDVTDDDDVYINVDLSGVSAANIASGTLSLLGIPAQGAQAYVPKVFQFTANVPASGTVNNDIPQDNICRVMLNTLTNMARLQVTKDRQVIVQATPAEALAISNFMTRVETAIATSIMVNLAPSGMFDENLSDDVQVVIDATAGGVCAPDVVYISIDPTPDVLARSRATLDNSVAVVHSRKVQLGKTRAVVASNAIQGVGTGSAAGK